MKRQSHEKLVRDSIPDFLRSKGIESNTREIPHNERREHLLRKLDEEAAEYRVSGEPMELADILEVIRGLAHQDGLTLDEVLEMMEQKYDERGGFFEGIYLIDTLEPTTSD